MNIRTATAADSAALAALFEQLGYPDTPDAVARRLAACGLDDRVLVFENESGVAGVLVMHVLVPVHTAAPWGRISALVTDARVRGQGVGAALLREAERLLRERGCARVELTSGDTRHDAHRFYRA
ncbi:MAG TPA: GNAT family N-acetyltransferase, partial [Burkholderiaceae bacterium]